MTDQENQRPDSPRAEKIPDESPSDQVSASLADAMIITGRKVDNLIAAVIVNNLHHERVGTLLQQLLVHADKLARMADNPATRFLAGRKKTGQP